MSTSHGTPAVTRSWERGTILPRKETVLVTSLLWASRLRSCEMTDFCRFKPPSLWCLVVTAGEENNAVALGGLAAPL